MLMSRWRFQFFLLWVSVYTTWFVTNVAWPKAVTYNFDSWVRLWCLWE